MPGRIPTHEEFNCVREAYGLCEAGLVRARIPLTPEMRDVVVVALMDLSDAGQRDPDALSRYALSKAVNAASEGV